MSDRPDNVTISALSADDRPRERLMRLGPAALRSDELLAILIGSGSPRENAVDLMRRILADCGGSLNTLGKMSFEALCRYSGIGEAKAVSILAACELGRRRQMEAAPSRPFMSSSQEIYRYFLDRLRDAPVEECHVLLLNQALRVIGSRCVSRGGIAGTVVDVRLVMREAILERATGIALCHNHPSGNPRPSRDDDEMTRRVARAAEALNIRFVDHIVLADGAYYSYSDEGKL